ncbi:MAG: hypothetical protein M3174_01905 [Actinomycetota bacterium]|nr:hypothetical protein [Actinomycetota bacterium]
MKCPSCGAENASGSFCQTCGTNLYSGQPSQSGQQPQQQYQTPMVVTGWGRPATPEETNKIMSTVKWTVIISVVVPIIATIGILYFVFSQF